MSEGVQLDGTLMVLLVVVHAASTVLFLEVWHWASAALARHRNRREHGAWLENIATHWGVEPKPGETEAELLTRIRSTARGSWRYPQ